MAMQAAEPAPRQYERPLRAGLSEMATLASGAIGVWLGLSALRGYLLMVVMNVAEDRPPLFMGLVALGVWALGLSGWVPARLLGRKRPAWYFGILLAVLVCARQALPGELLSPALSFAAVIAWLWWFPAYLKEAAGAGRLGWVAPGMVLGLSLQVAWQTALNGLDLIHWTGMWSVAALLLASAGFLAALRAGAGGELPPEEQRAAESGAARGALLFGPYLFVQFTYLTHLSRTQIETGWSLPAVSALIQAGLLAAVVAVMWNPPRWVRLTLGLAAVGLLVPGQLGGLALFGLIPIQVGLGLALGAACSPAPGGRGAVYSLSAVGALLWFVIFFLYAANYGMVQLWSVAAALVVLIGALARGAESPPVKPPAAALAAVAVLAIGVSLIPHPAPAAESATAPRELTVLNYNIHQGLDFYSAPSVRALAAFVQSVDADLITLQEVPRGSANISGGTDLVMWLRWRFPHYQIVAGPHHGDLFVNAVMSRYPIEESGTMTYRAGGVADVRQRARVQRGLVWASVRTEAGPLLLVSTHLSAYGYASDRDEQSEALLRFWASRPRSVLAGDMNATPAEEPIRKTVAAGLTDAAAVKGMDGVFTFSSGRPQRRIDYIFVTPDIRVLAVEVPPIRTSDHLPLVARLQLR
jgi:endonuclease/exonuclease/phosphatase family metal-dependent hydrolase